MPSASLSKTPTTMKKKKVTYGVSGMMEYQAVVKVGKKNVSINFSDGSISAMGINPASYTTDNIIMQNAIEASSDFKRGRITIVRTIVLDEDLPIIRNAPKPAQSPIPTASPQPQPEHEIAHEANNGSQEVADTPQEESIAEAPDTPEEPEEETAPLTQVEFSCNDDAKDYLEQFGYVRSKLRNRDDIIAAGKAHDVEIIFV